MRTRGGTHVVGSLRPSNFLYANGIGSVVDLPAISAIVLGLDAWTEQQGEVIREPRLLQVLQRAFGPQLSALRALPYADDEPAGDGDREPTGVPVSPFPSWLLCPMCRMLLHVESGLLELKAPPFRPERAHYVHKNCRYRANRPAVPVRFMRACERGHLDDLPWVEFAHKGPTTCPSRLQLDQYGVTGEAARIIVRCLDCGANRSMAHAFGPETDPLIADCPGRHPHLGGFVEEACDSPARTITLGASNSWFPATFSVISVPSADGELAQLVERHLADLAAAGTEEILAAFLQIDKRPYSDLKRYGAGAVWEALTRARAAEAGEEGGTLALRPPEWAALTADPLPRSDDFRARPLPPSGELARWFERVVLVDRMRFVQALVGFTRLEAPDDPDSLGADPVDPAPITRGDLHWVPATESRGEGIFLQVREDAIASWCADSRLAELERAHRLAHAAELERRRLTPEQRPFPGMRYLLLHSFAHALMREIALECGYAAASLRERVYSLEATDEGGPMAGVLIATSEPDSEGTLGGLVRLGERDQLPWHIMQALRAVHDCASDPYCAEHEPGREDRSLHGAACHACLFAPETSCERGNRYLDRRVLVETFADGGAEFFRGIAEP